METKKCLRCEGVDSHKCYACDGKGHFEKPDYTLILQEIKGRKGLRSSRPKSKRAYYVWRMARFHGGQDVTMPIIAECEISGDPYEPELSKLADMVARHVLGTDMAAAHRWGRVMGYIKNDIPGLPLSAYENGPVVLDRNKPIEELAELI